MFQFTELGYLFGTMVPDFDGCTHTPYLPIDPWQLCKLYVEPHTSLYLWSAPKFFSIEATSSKEQKNPISIAFMLAQSLAFELQGLQELNGSTPRLPLPGIPCFDDVELDKAFFVAELAKMVTPNIRHLLLLAKALYIADAISLEVGREAPYSTGSSTLGAFDSYVAQALNLYMKITDLRSFTQNTMIASECLAYKNKLCAFFEHPDLAVRIRQIMERTENIKSTPVVVQEFLISLMEHIEREYAILYHRVIGKSAGPRFGSIKDLTSITIEPTMLGSVVSTASTLIETNQIPPTKEDALSVECFLDFNLDSLPPRVLVPMFMIFAAKAALRENQPASLRQAIKKRHKFALLIWKLLDTNLDTATFLGWIIDADATELMDLVLTHLPINLDLTTACKQCSPEMTSVFRKHGQEELINFNSNINRFSELMERSYLVDSNLQCFVPVLTQGFTLELTYNPTHRGLSILAPVVDLIPTLHHGKLFHLFLERSVMSAELVVIRGKTLYIQRLLSMGGSHDGMALFNEINVLLSYLEVIRRQWTVWANTSTTMLPHPVPEENFGIAMHQIIKFVQLSKKSDVCMPDFSFVKLPSQREIKSASSLQQSFQPTCFSTMFTKTILNLKSVGNRIGCQVELGKRFVVDGRFHRVIFPQSNCDMLYLTWEVEGFPMVPHLLIKLFMKLLPLMESYNSFLTLLPGNVLAFLFPCNMKTAISYPLVTTYESFLEILPGLMENISEVYPWKMVLGLFEWYNISVNELGLPRTIADHVAEYAYYSQMDASNAEFFNLLNFFPEHEEPQLPLFISTILPSSLPHLPSLLPPGIQCLYFEPQKPPSLANRTP
jgi:hypothetical protein